MRPHNIQDGIIAHKPARLHRNERLHRALHEKLGRKPLTLEETHSALAWWFELYSSRGQSRTHLRGKSPSEVYLAGRGAGVDMERLTLMMLQKEIRTISKDGIRLFGRLYWSEELANRRHPVLVRHDLQLSPFTVLVYDLDGNLICEARDRQHYQIASGIHPAANILGTESQKQDLTAALAFKKGQERDGKSGIRGIIESVIIPESQQRQIATTFKARPLPEKKIEPMSASEKAEIEAAKARAMREMDAPAYEPSLTRRWVDEPARYKYLFEAKYESGCELMPEDEAFMARFEQSEMYQRNYKPLYESRLETMRWQKQEAASA